MQWPAFVLFTALDAVVIAELPPSVVREPNLIVGLLATTFGNLVLIGAVAPFLARRLAQRESDQTGREILQDRTATVLLAVGLLACLVSGLANRPVIVSETEATEANARLVEGYVARRGSEEVKRNLDSANTRRLSEGFFRTCVALDDRTKAFCMFVDTKRETVVPDSDARPNGEIAR